MSSDHDRPATAIDWRDRFSDAYDGELDAAEQAAFDAWLASDAAGRAEYESFCSSLSLFHDLDFNRAPRDLVRAVTADIRRQSRGAFFAGDGWWLGFRVPYEVFAAVVLAIFATLYLFGAGLSTRSYAVSDAPQPDAPQPDAPGSRAASDRPGAGLAAGVVARSVTLDLPADVDPGLASRLLRGDGFATRPELFEERDAVLVSVPAGQLERFVERLFVVTGVDHREVLLAAQHGSAAQQRMLTVRLVRAATP